MISSTDILYKTAVSYFASHGEEPMTHHPTKGMDGDSATCFFSGYQSVAWWSVTFGREHDIQGVDVYGTVLKKERKKERKKARNKERKKERNKQTNKQTKKIIICSSSIALYPQTSSERFTYYYPRHTCTHQRTKQTNKQTNKQRRSLCP